MAETTGIANHNNPLIRKNRGGAQDNLAAQAFHDFSSATARDCLFIDPLLRHAHKTTIAFGLDLP